MNDDTSLHLRACPLSRGDDDDDDDDGLHLAGNECASFFTCASRDATTTRCLIRCE